MSTGLENEADIDAYIELCMQAWQTPETDIETNPATEAAAEPVASEQ